MNTPLRLIALLLLAALTLSSCETPGQTALLGAAIGGASGRNPIRNAAIGAAAGYVVGKIAQHERRKRDEEEGLPVAERARRYGFVYSPYSPAVIDVRGIPSGAHVVDPTTNRTFINP